MDVNPFVMPHTETHFLNSGAVGREFAVHLGHAGTETETPGGVVYLGDPSLNFGTAVEILRLLRWSDSVPPTLVVGVGYRSAEMSDVEDLRTRDFTPTETVGDARGEAGTGGADAFLAFLRDELKPWVARRYDLDTARSMFFGDSLGGLFATHVLLTEPGLFDGLGIGSPSLWWDDDLMFSREQAYAATHSDLPAHVYVSVGGLENRGGFERFVAGLPEHKRAGAIAEDEVDPWEDMVGATERFVAALRSRNYPSLDLEFEIHPDEYHETVPSLNLSRSIRRLLGAPR